MNVSPFPDLEPSKGSRPPTMDPAGQSPSGFHATTWTFALVMLGLAVGCDGNQRSRDASAPLTQNVAEVSIRIDVPSGGAPSVSVLAFKAAANGLEPSDVLSAVDP